MISLAECDGIPAVEIGIGGSSQMLGVQSKEGFMSFGLRGRSKVEVCKRWIRRSWNLGGAEALAFLS